MEKKDYMPDGKKELGSVTLGDGTVVEVSKPTLTQIRAVNKIEDEEAQEVKLISNLTGLTEEKLGFMLYDDYVLLSNKVNNFLYQVGKMRESALA